MQLENTEDLVSLRMNIGNQLSKVMEVIRAKSSYFTAIKITESRIISGAVSAVNRNFIRTNSRDQVTVKTPEGDKIARCGDWIVEVDKKNYLVLSGHQFKSLFDKF